MTDRREFMKEDMRFRILKILDNSPEMSQRDLARAVGISLGSVNFQLKALVDKGLVKLGNFSANPDKRRYSYILTPRGIATKTSLTRRFLARKRAEYEALRAEIEALQSEVDGEPTPSE